MKNIALPLAQIVASIFVGIVFGALAWLSVGGPLPSASVYASRVDDVRWLQSTPIFICIFSGIASLSGLRYRKIEITHLSPRARIGMVLMLLPLSPLSYLPPFSCGIALILPLAFLIVAAQPKKESKDWDWLAGLFILIVGAYALIIMYRSFLRFTD